MFVVTYRKFFYILSAVLLILSIGAVAKWGLNYGIDFKGGAILELEYASSTPSQATLVSELAPLNLGESVRPTGTNGYIIRMRTITQDEKIVLTNIITASGTIPVIEKRFDSIGPVLGTEALRKSLASIIFVLLAIILFVAFAFRKVSEPVSSFKYGLIAIIALLHDVIIPTGVFAVLGHFLGYEIDTLFVTALLVILGFSVHDTIVVFDRVRENLNHAKANTPFDQIVGESISQTFTRSINTSLTTLLALVVLYLVGGEATHHFSLALIIGIVAGTYSSIFVGSPLLVTVWKWQLKRQTKKVGKK
ncbi:MAG: Protein-export rane protein SecF [Patescibacteria group bacterium]|nr:Protein-export rane protein SecF [Patescibacteria group bacterium]